MLSAAIGALALTGAAALDNGLARTPQMGWNTWNYYGCDINETVVRDAADTMVSSGLLKAGYEYLNIDDCWQSHERAADGSIVPNPDKFPSGMGALADYVHGQGLKFGIYSDRGNSTCGGYPGSHGFEAQDAASYASWGVDYLKYDNCYADTNVREQYGTMRDALAATGRPILFSMCEWGTDDVWLWGRDYGNSWRTTNDIADKWDALLRVLDNSVGLGKYAEPGSWPDLDMLEVGNGGMSQAEYRAHFALWSLFKSPLILGMSLYDLDQGTLDIVTAPEVLAVSQDPLGVAGELVWKEGPNEVYAGPLADGSRAVVLFNRHLTGSQILTEELTVQFTDLGWGAHTQVVARDLYAAEDLGTFTGNFTAEVGLHDVAVVKLTPVGSGGRRS